jgi:hypothetical protein
MPGMWRNSAKAETFKLRHYPRNGRSIVQIEGRGQSTIAMPESDQHDPPMLEYSNMPRRRRWWPLLLFLALLVLVIALGVTLLLPSDNPSRPTANRVKSASNLRQMGQAILLYTQGHNGEYPDSFGTLLLNQSITSDVFISSGSNDEAADGQQPKRSSPIFPHPVICRISTSVAA